MIGVLVLRRAGTQAHRRRMAAVGDGRRLVGARPAGRCLETATSPTWAYFNTLPGCGSRAGAVLACSVGRCADSAGARAGGAVGYLVLIAVSIFVISEVLSWFSAPWALLLRGGGVAIAAGGWIAGSRRSCVIRCRRMSVISRICCIIWADYDVVVI